MRFGMAFALWAASTGRPDASDRTTGWDGGNRLNMRLCRLEHGMPSSYGQTKHNASGFDPVRGEVLAAGWKHPQASMSANVNRWALDSPITPIRFGR